MRASSEACMVGLSTIGNKVTGEQLHNATPPHVRAIRRTLLVGSLLTLLLPALSVAAAGQSTSSGTPDEITPLVATVLATPRPVLGTDGQIHLPYELFV